MKKLAALSLALLLCLCACGGEKDPGGGGAGADAPEIQAQAPDGGGGAANAPPEPSAPPQDGGAGAELNAYLEGLGLTVEDVTPAQGLQSFGVRTYTEYDGEIQVYVEEQDARQQHAFYQQLTARSRILSEDGALHDPSDYDAVLEDDTVEDFETGAWTTAWSYLRDGYLFQVTFYYYPAGSGGGYIIGFGATRQ